MSIDEPNRLARFLREEPVIAAHAVAYAYQNQPAVCDVDLEVGAGEVLAIMGRSGSGKSTLLYCLAGILRPDSGAVYFRGTDLGGLSDDERSALRRKSFGFVFQFGELIPELSLEENVALPLELVGTGRRESRKRARELLDALGVLGVSGRRPSAVSGGQAQRAAVARALAHRPDVVFADEPTGALDEDNAVTVLGEMVTLARENGSAVVLVTHDPSVARVADRTVSMVDGSLMDAAAV